MPDSGADEVRRRAFWSGTVTFGLVSVPVGLYPAVRSGGVSLRMLAPDGTPLERRWWCPADEQEVGWDELVRGWELDDGSFVVLTDEELEGVLPEKSRDIDLRRFVDRAELDPVFFDRAYVLAPAGESTKAYRLLAAAMEDEGLAGIATFVMRSKEYLVAILSEGGVLRAETLRFAGEVRTADYVGLDEPGKTPAKRRKAMAKAIASLEEDAIDPDELTDEDAAELRALVERKRKKGKDVVEPTAPQAPAPSDGDVIDLMQVLKRSLEGEGRAGPGRAGRKGGRKASGGSAKGGTGGEEGSSKEQLSELTKAELYERAQELDVPGRSSMTKDELVEALGKAG